MFLIANGCYFDFLLLFKANDKKLVLFHEENYFKRKTQKTFLKNINKFLFYLNNNFHK